MLYINSPLKRASQKKKSAFSLVEVLITLLVIAIVIVLAAPHLTKKAEFTTRTEGVVYTYDGNNIQQNSADVRCIALADNSTSTYVSTKQCSEYEFTVPQGIHKVSMTLVAGGGGGGGAAGPVRITKEIITNNNLGWWSHDIRVDELKNFVIKHMVGTGENGGNVRTNISTLNSGHADAVFQLANSGSQVKIVKGIGGKSSFALRNYVVPKEFYEIQHSNVRNLENATRRFSTAEGSLIMRTPTTNSYVNAGSVERTFIVSPDGYNCCVGNGTCAPDGNGDCKINIPSQNVLPSVSGSSSGNYLLDKNLGNAYKYGKNYGYLEGGAGGTLSYESTYGAGGKGGSILCGKNKPTGCSDSWCKKLQDLVGGASCSNLSEASGDVSRCGYIHENPLVCYKPTKKGSTERVEGEPGKRGIIKIEYTAEARGQVGGGGAGGSAVKINNFPVNPGETYIIRVGKGGEKGNAGKYGHPASTVGNDGKSGTSTSIWRRNGNSETLLYMVSGGIGGGGGAALNAFDDGGTATDHVSSTPNNRRYAPLLIVNNTNANTLLSYVDNNLTALYSTCNVTLPSTLNGISTNCVHFPRYDYRIESSNRIFNTPYGYLNYNNEAVDSINFGGFGSYTSSNTNIATIDGINYFTSFYFRTLKNSQFGYPGGLGGFSGIGGKAGCGGLFSGNPNGYGINGGNATYNPNGANKLFIPEQVPNTGTPAQNVYKAYNVADFYDNCTTSTSNGQTAEFILPDPKKQSLGQAGAGGGGGGYTLEYGAGDGGAGQNGYVMINWRK